MKFIEETESAWSAEQLAAAEREIEEQKREWEENRLAAMREEEERIAREQLEEENEILTFSREDATNQVSTSKTKKLNNSTAKKILKNRAIKKRGNKIMKKIRPNKYTNDRSIAKAKLRRKNCNRRRLTRLAIAKKEEVITESEESQCSSKSTDATDEKKINGDTDSSVDDEQSTTDEQSESDSRSTVWKTTTNSVDTNSPRTRSRGTVEINLWTLDVSPILPGVKPVKNSPNPTVKRSKEKKKYVKKESDDDEEDDIGENANHAIPQGKICKVMLNDIMDGQYNLGRGDEEKNDSGEEIEEGEDDSTLDSKDAEIVNNKSDSVHIDNGLDEPKNCMKKVKVKNKKFAKCVNNRTLDDWVTRSSPIYKTPVNCKKVDVNVDSEEVSLKRTCLEAGLNDLELSQTKIIKTE